MQVLAMELTPRVSITLINGHDGWRFASWGSRGGLFDSDPLPEPSPEDVALRFSSPTEALTHFRRVAR